MYLPTIILQLRKFKMANTKKITSLNLVKDSKRKGDSKVSALSPREIVSELDRYVIGQMEAKKAAGYFTNEDTKKGEDLSEVKGRKMEE